MSGQRNNELENRLTTLEVTVAGLSSHIETIGKQLTDIRDNHIVHLETRIDGLKNLWIAVLASVVVGFITIWFK